MKVSSYQERCGLASSLLPMNAMDVFVQKVFLARRASFGATHQKGPFFISMKYRCVEFAVFVGLWRKKESQRWCAGRIARALCLYRRSPWFTGLPMPQVL